MDRYTKVEQKKPDVPINENEIRITSQGLVRNYISYATTLLQDKQGIVKQIYKGVIFLRDENESENCGYFCAKSQICEKMESSADLLKGKGGKSDASGFDDFPASPKSPLSPQKPFEGRENSRNWIVGTQVYLGGFGSVYWGSFGMDLNKDSHASQTLRVIDSLRKQFYYLLRDGGLVDNMDKCNTWSHDEHLIRAIICSGLFPGICSVVNKKTSVLLKTMEDDPVLLYSDGHLKMLGGYLEFFMKPGLAGTYLALKRELDELIQMKISCVWDSTWV